MNWDWSVLQAPLFWQQAGSLPQAGAMQWARQLLWAGVFAGAMLALLGRVGPGMRWSLAAVAAAVALLPGPMGPVHWLALAFQTPSLSSAVACLYLGLRRHRAAAPAPTGPDPGMRDWLQLWSLAAVALGWVLLLDSFAFWPWSVYAWGFGAAALAAAALLAGLPWLSGATPFGASAVPWLVLLLYVLTRCPSGNLWDALLDPWLWAALQLQLLAQARRAIKARRAPAATRA